MTADPSRRTAREDHVVRISEVMISSVQLKRSFEFQVNSQEKKVRVESTVQATVRVVSAAREKPTTEIPEKVQGCLFVMSFRAPRFLLHPHDEPMQAELLKMRSMRSTHTHAALEETHRIFRMGNRPDIWPCQNWNLAMRIRGRTCVCNASSSVGSLSCFDVCAKTRSAATRVAPIIPKRSAMSSVISVPLDFSIDPNRGQEETWQNSAEYSACI